MSKTNYGERLTLEFTLGITARSAPSGLKVGLATAAADAEAGTFTVLASGTGGYAEQSVAFVMDSDSQASNSAVVDFGKATSDLGHPTHFFVKDSGGNVLRYGVLPSGGFDYNTNIQPSFAAGTLVITED